MATAPALLDHSKLPSIEAARLPALYEAAKVALAECARIDECREWADRMEALASYARQSDDPELLKPVLRIKARAIDRCGELLKEIPASSGGDRKSDEFKKDGVRPSDRDLAASEAGLSPHQAKQAVRVNNVPRDQFEQLVESEDPPTVTALAELGTKHHKPLVDLGGRDPEDFAAATPFRALPKEFLEEAKTFQLERAWRGMTEDERIEVRADYLDCVDWITQAWEAIDGL